MLFISVILIGGCTYPKRDGYRPTPGNNRYYPPATDYVPLDKIQVKQSFKVVSLNKNNLANELVKCVSTLDPNSESIKQYENDFPLKNATVTTSHISTSRVFIFHDTSGLCLEYSANKYPIFAAETFFETANPTGVPPEITTEWYKQIAKLIAIKGKAKIIYATGKGTAFIVSYWSDQGAGNLLNYSSEFKKVGEWENLQADFKYTHQAMQGFSNTKRGEKFAKSFPSARGF